MEFLLPVRLGDVLTISATVLKKHERERLLELDTKIVNQNQQLILTGVGKVKVLVAAEPEAKPAADARPRVAIVTLAASARRFASAWQRMDLTWW
jgi:3-oxoacyl-[acyl-carrier protein] reductase